MLVLVVEIPKKQHSRADVKEAKSGSENLKNYQEFEKGEVWVEGVWQSLQVEILASGFSFEAHYS